MYFTWTCLLQANGPTTGNTVKAVVVRAETFRVYYDGSIGTAVDRTCNLEQEQRRRRQSRKSNGRTHPTRKFVHLPEHGSTLVHDNDSDEICRPFPQSVRFWSSVKKVYLTLSFNHQSIKQERTSSVTRSLLYLQIMMRTAIVPTAPK